MATGQSPSVQTVPAPDYQDAVFTGMISCSPEPDSEYCSNVADKFYTVKLKGRDYVLKPGLSNQQMLAMMTVAVASEGRLFLIILHRNVLGKLPENTPVQVRFHGGGIDVRVVAQTKKGKMEYLASHYDIAVSQMEPTHHAAGKP
jgi:hypothetical protein